MPRFYMKAILRPSRTFGAVGSEEVQIKSNVIAPNEQHARRTVLERAWHDGHVVSSIDVVKIKETP